MFGDALRRDAASHQTVLPVRCAVPGLHQQGPEIMTAVIPRLPAAKQPTHLRGRHRNQLFIRTVAAPFSLLLRLMFEHRRIRVRQHRQSERRGGQRARARALLSGAQTLPDHRGLAGSDSIELPHLAEALQYRPRWAV